MRLWLTQKPSSRKSVVSRRDSRSADASSRALVLELISFFFAAV